MTYHNYASQILLGKRYRDQDTGFEGVASCIAFYRNREEQVQLRALISSVPVEHWFDALLLTRIDDDSKAVGFGNGGTATFSGKRETIVQ